MTTQTDSNWIQQEGDEELPPYSLHVRNNNHHHLSTPNHLEKFSKEAKFKDVWVIPLFCSQLAAFVYLSYVSITAFGTPLTTTTSVGGIRRPVLVTAALGHALGISTLIGFCLSMAYFIFIRKFPFTAIQATLLGSVNLCFFVSAYFFVLKVIWAGFVPVIVGILYFIFWAYWRSRFHYASTMLATVTDITRNYKGMLGATILASLLQMIYGVCLFITILGILYMTHDDPADCTIEYKRQKQSKTTCPNDAKRAILMIFAFVSYYWGSQVIKTTVNVTVSGVFAAYYFLKETPEGVPSWPTIGSAKRALTTSFGSVCCGGLVVAIFRTMRAMLISDAIDFNHYAYVHVAVYGKSYYTAAKETWGLIQDRGVDAIINDNLIGYVMTLGEVLVGGVTAFLVLLYLTILGQEEEAIAICTFAFFIGFSLTVLVGEIVESGTATTFFALAEDPDTIAHATPVLFEIIRQEFPHVNIRV